MAQSRSAIVAAWLVITSLGFRFVVWYLELSHLLPATNFTSMLAIATALFAIMRMFSSRRRQWTPIDLISAAILFYCGIVIYLGYLKHGDFTDFADKSFTAYNVTVFVQSALYYVIGRVFLGDALGCRKILFYGWFALSIFIIANSNISPLGISLDRIDEKDRGIYLSLADMYALLSIIIVATEIARRKVLPLLIFSAVTLYLVHSRGAFLIFLFATTVLHFSQLGVLRFLQAAGWLVFSGVTLVFLGWDYISSNERMLGIFVDPLSDSSLQSRLIQLFGGIQDIMDNPFFGRYGGQIEMYDFIGWYIHSVLSYWRQFGLLPFMAITFLLVYYPWRLLQARGRVSCQHRNLLHTLVVFCTIESIFVKAYGWYFLWMLFGYMGWIYKYLVSEKKRGFILSSPRISAARDNIQRQYFL